MIKFGGENDQIAEKLHRSTLALFAAPDLETTLAVLYHSLKEDFGVPQVASRLWGRVPEQSYLPELAATTLELREYADQVGRTLLRTAGAVRIARMVRRRGCLALVCVLAAAHRAHVRPPRPCQRGPGAFLSRHGHALSHPAGRTGERGDRALPAAGLTPTQASRDVRRGAMMRTSPPDSPSHPVARANLSLLEAFAHASRGEASAIPGPRTFATLRCWRPRRAMRRSPDSLRVS